MVLEIRIKRAEEYSARQLAAEMLADAVGSAPEDISSIGEKTASP